MPVISQATSFRLFHLHPPALISYNQHQAITLHFRDSLKRNSNSSVRDMMFAWAFDPPENLCTSKLPSHWFSHMFTTNYFHAVEVEV